MRSLLWDGKIVYPKAPPPPLRTRADFDEATFHFKDCIRVDMGRSCDCSRDIYLIFTGGTSCEI
jgi:hypothetical protein